METKIVKIDREAVDERWIKEGAEILRAGGLVAFPTETVYGLGANGLDQEAVAKIFTAKGRPQDNPLILHISSMEDLDELVEEVSDMARLAMERFWPGPLTLLFKKSEKVPDMITAGLDTVAIRMPENAIAQRLIALSKLPIAAPSANLSGKPSPTSADHVIEDLAGRIDMIIDGGPTGIGLESTVVDLSGDRPMILRPGKVTLEDLREIIPNIIEDAGIIRDDVVPRSPGQKYRHYAPRAEMVVFTGDMDAMVADIVENARRYMEEGKKVGIMATDETKDNYRQGLVLSSGSRQEKETIAHNLFKLIRKFDEKNVDIILAEAVEFSHLGMAIMNRLVKAASGNIRGGKR